MVMRDAGSHPRVRTPRFQVSDRWPGRRRGRRGVEGGPLPQGSGVREVPGTVSDQEGVAPPDRWLEEATGWEGHGGGAGGGTSARAPTGSRQAVAMSMEVRKTVQGGVKRGGASSSKRPLDRGQQDMHFCLKKLEMPFASRTWRISAPSWNDPKRRGLGTPGVASRFASRAGRAQASGVEGVARMVGAS